MSDFGYLEDECEGCGDGDKVPARGYWKCPVCDAEWFPEEDEDDLEGPFTRTNPFGERT